MSNIVKFRTTRKWSKDISITVTGAILAGLLLGKILPEWFQDRTPTPAMSPLSLEGDISGSAFIIDGDTVKINQSHVRLHGIDAPEIKQLCWNSTAQYQCGREAKSYLKQLIDNQSITCKTINKDRYGRDVAKCFNDKGVDVNAAMVASGHAIAYLYYSQDYLPQQVEAKNQKLGIWAGRFIEPYLFRKRNGPNFK
ncbi:thermonuclease family protein [Paremcibacter congregatus]|uniref:thermonuclease family protein n=1 Tax=Paremcibacter congregatus TaxID=2043170 RepID=UPI0030EE0CFF|tara:strand:+ start:421 stop:1008 length:588 start_codon:yes stop_codon:yes gene_type:complete